MCRRWLWIWDRLCVWQVPDQHLTVHVGGHRCRPGRLPLCRRSCPVSTRHRPLTHTHTHSCLLFIYIYSVLTHAVCLALFWCDVCYAFLAGVMYTVMYAKIVQHFCIVFVWLLVIPFIWLYHLFCTPFPTQCCVIDMPHMCFHYSEACLKGIFLYCLRNKCCGI